MKLIRPSAIASMLYTGRTTLWGLERRGDLPPKRTSLKRSSGPFEDNLSRAAEIRRASRSNRYNKSNI
ncbi:MAG: hypothetical protein ACNA8K_00790 [Cyclonatronaceae bacterium]